MGFKRKIYYGLQNRYPLAFKFYNDYKTSNLDFHEQNKTKSWKYLFKLIFSNQNEGALKKVKLPKGANFPIARNSIEFNMIESSVNKRPGIKRFTDIMSKYDIISFDIFDTAVLRNVENPRDVFLIMASELPFPDFKNIRNRAEETARETSYEKCNSRETTLDEIYDILNKHYGIDKKWREREIELELDLCIANPYFFEIYERLVKIGKRIIFTTDMYLPLEIIEKILHKCGYAQYEKVLLSSELKLSKTTGTIYEYICNNYAPTAKIFHVGDNYNADIKNAKMFKIDTTYYHSVRELAKPYREKNINNLGGSFFRATINNALHCGNWRKSLRYEHGFRVGGILTYGYCNFISNRAKEVNADLILFCSRDCDIISKVYLKYFNDIKSKYIKISRFAIMKATIERNLYDFVSRALTKNLEKKERDTIRKILESIDLCYLVDVLSNDGIDIESQISLQNIEHVKNAILEYRKIIIKNNAKHINAAKQYFGEILSEHKNILIVDIGWSGSSITALQYFINKHFGKHYNVFGSLLIGSDNDTLNSSLMNGTITTYLSSAVNNIDLLKKQFVGDRERTNLNNQMFEYMFTSTDASLLSYEFENGQVHFSYVEKKYNNDVDIRELHRGIIDFADSFNKITYKYKNLFVISPHVASGAFYETMTSLSYCKKIYGSFIYDAAVSNYSGQDIITFDKLLPQETSIKKNISAKNILLISHSFSYTGAPNSLLRIGKVLIKNGFNVEVWSPYGGGLSTEFEKANISIRIIKPFELNKFEIINLVKTFDFAICNTILTHEYYRKINKYIPAVWYIREASNIPDYCSEHHNILMHSNLMHAKNIVCVSEYAAKHIRNYNKNVTILYNCVEDMSSYAKNYAPCIDGKVKFIQLGSLEIRKGYHILLEAIKSLPTEYREQCELYFAGQIVPTSKEYADDILNLAKSIPNVKYLGVIQDRNKMMEIFSQMDVAVVASLDESCSLVALEGVMLSKPLIVTENVGAKYVVENGGNGYIVQTDDVDALRQAIISCIDNREKLSSMGKLSRTIYEEKSSMESYCKNILSLVNRFINSKISIMTKISNAVMYSKRRERSDYIKFANKSLGTKEFDNILEELKKRYPKLAQKFLNKNNICIENNIKKKQSKMIKDERIIVSLTSYPPRMSQLHICLETLFNQYFKPDEIVLWLAKDQFLNLESDIPNSVLEYKKKGLKIMWCDEDIKPHKKYYYAMKNNPDAIIVTVDDDMRYAPSMLGKLYESFKQHPHAVSCLRAHRISFNSNNRIKNYKDWLMEDNSIISCPSYQLVPTGCCGVLYPPNCLPNEAFNIDKIKELALMTDDLWLKIMCVANDYPAILVEKQGKIRSIENTQDTAISLVNVEVINDKNLNKIITEYNKKFGSSTILKKIQQDII